MDMFKNAQDDLVMNIDPKKEEDDDQNKDVGINIAAGYAATESARVSTQKAIQKYAKPDTYTGNRNLYDSGKAKRNAKEVLFEKNGGNVFDPYTGEKLCLKKCCPSN